MIAGRHRLPPRRRDLIRCIHRLDRGPFVEEINQDEGGCALVFGRAGLQGEAELARLVGVGGVGEGDVVDVGGLDVEERRFLVEEVVHQRHFVLGEGGGGVVLHGARAVGFAGELVGLGVFEVVLEDEGEFVHEVGHGVGNGGGLDGGDEGEEALVGGDEVVESGPGRGGGGFGWGCVGVLGYVGGLEVGVDILGGEVVGVDEEEGDYIAGVGVEPFFDFHEPGGEDAGIEEVAGGVAEVDVAIGLVDLCR